MPRIVVTHDVADVAEWLKYKSERADAIAKMGGSNVVDHVAGDGNSVAVVADVSDVAAMTAALSSPPPEVLTLMQSHGVIPPLTIYVEQ